VIEKTKSFFRSRGHFASFSGFGLLSIRFLLTGLDAKKGDKNEYDSGYCILPDDCHRVVGPIFSDWFWDLVDNQP